MLSYTFLGNSIEFKDKYYIYLNGEYKFLRDYHCHSIPGSF